MSDQELDISGEEFSEFQAILELLESANTDDFSELGRILGRDPKVDLIGADLSGVNLDNGDLSNANLANTNLSGADLSNANLANTNLSGADLSNANLANTNLSGAVLDDLSNISIRLILEERSNSSKLNGEKELLQKNTVEPDVDEKNVNLSLSIFTQFYPPDFAATGQLIEELVHNLTNHGMRVEVFTGQPGYAFSKASAPVREEAESFTVHRSRFARFFPNKVRGKAINGLMFALGSALHLLKPSNRGDVLLLTTAPPFLPILGYFAQLFFGIPYICLLFDLYPDVAVGLGVVSEDHWATKLWDFINRCTWRNAESIIVLSSSMRERIVAKCPEVADKISVIHSWANPNRIVPMPKESNWFSVKHRLTEKFTVLYSGNMGRCHDLDTILEAAIELQDEPIQFVFIGNGAKRQSFINRVNRLNLENCLFLPYQSKSDLPYTLTSSDLTLVSLARGMEGLVAPSKLYSSLAAGRPVAVICEKQSYLRQLINDAKCGACFDNNDGHGLAEYIKYLSKDSDVAHQLGTAGRSYMESHFTVEIAARQYSEAIKLAAFHSSLKSQINSGFKELWEDSLSIILDFMIALAIPPLLPFISIRIHMRTIQKEQRSSRINQEGQEDTAILIEAEDIDVFDSTYC